MTDKDPWGWKLEIFCPHHIFSILTQLNTYYEWMREFWQNVWISELVDLLGVYLNLTMGTRAVRIGTILLYSVHMGWKWRHCPCLVIAYINYVHIQYMHTQQYMYVWNTYRYIQHYMYICSYMHAHLSLLCGTLHSQHVHMYVINVRCSCLLTSVRMLLHHLCKAHYNLSFLFMLLGTNKGTDQTSMPRQATHHIRSRKEIRTALHVLLTICSD